jgi:hypothetical protein
VRGHNYGRQAITMLARAAVGEADPLARPSAIAAGEFSKKKIRRLGSLSGHDPARRSAATRCGARHPRAKG